MKSQWSTECRGIIMVFHHDHSLLEMNTLAFLPLLGTAMTIRLLGSTVGLRHLVTIVIMLPRSLQLVLVNMMIIEEVLRPCLTGIAILPRLLATTEVVILRCQILLTVATLFLRLTMIAMIEGLMTDLELIHLATDPVLRLEEEKSMRDLPGLSIIMCTSSDSNISIVRSPNIVDALSVRLVIPSIIELGQSRLDDIGGQLYLQSPYDC
jgi:hypothetical protein